MIPKLHYISQGETPKMHLEHIQKACTCGAELVQLRLKDISEKKALKIASEARDITAYYQTRLIINDYYKIAKLVKADGVHLGTLDTCPTVAQKQLYSWQIIGGTAYTYAHCKTLLDKRVNYISLGPFRETLTKKNAPKPLGLQGFVAITDVLKTGTPILGVGGITVDDVPAILASGISGIAVSQAITHNFNAINTFHKLLNASATAAQRFTFS